MTESWHADAQALQAYADGSAAPAVAWSVEAHVVECPRCRDVLARLVPGDELAALRTGLQLPRPARSRSRAAWVEGVLGPWWAWASLLTLGVVGLLLAGRLPVPQAQQRLGLTWALTLSPLLPVVVTAAVYAVADRDATVRATPRGGLELVLIRTSAALALTVPVVVLTLWGAVGWLLPGLGLSLGALALGSWLGVERAAVGLATSWVALVALAMAPRSGLAAALAPVVGPSGRGVVLWALLLLATAAVTVVRRHDFEVPRRLA